MSVMYVLTPGTRISRRGKRILIQRGGGFIDSVAVQRIQAIVLGSGCHLTLPASRLLLRNRVTISLLNQSFRLIGRTCPPMSGQSLRRLRQYETIRNPVQRLRLARQIVVEKIEAMIGVLKAYAKNYVDDSLKARKRKLAGALHGVKNAVTMAELRGHEGAAAVVYWSCFRHLLRTELTFAKRSTRPPQDPVNALLSFGYALLTQEVITSIEASGLDPFLGFYHDPKSQRASLALDLMEPLRHTIVDRMVLKGVNLGKFSANDFRPGPNGGVWLTVVASQRFARQYARLRVRTLESATGDPLIAVISQYVPLLTQTASPLAPLISKPDQSTKNTQE